MRQVAERHAFFTILFLVLSPGNAQSRDGEKTRVPRCFADCLFRDRPASGQWATYTLDLNAEQRGKILPKRTLTVRSAMIPVKGSRELEWFEVTIRDETNKPPIYVAKLLVEPNEKVSGKNEWWLMSQKPIGWEKRQEDITRFTEESVDSSAILVALIVYGQSEMVWVQQPAVDVNTKAGRFSCIGFRWRPMSDDQPRVSCRLHPNVPFGCVSFSLEFQLGDKLIRARMQLVSHGKDAKSDLPDWELIGLSEDSARPTEKKSNQE